MRFRPLPLLVASLALGLAAPAAPENPPGGRGLPAGFSLPKQDRHMVLDSNERNLTVRPGQESCSFTFRLTNTGDSELVIQTVRTSCGCSGARLPADPWRLAPGASGEFEIFVDLRGKHGELIKNAIVQSNRGYQRIDFRITIPEPDPREVARERNLMIAQADRQAVFRGECATCHAAPAEGRTGRELYVAVCAICHGAEHRASMVPDLHALSPAPDAEVWRQAIAIGKPGTLMPAFALAEGGPLTRPQIESLVEYLTTSFRSERPAPAPPAPAEPVKD